LACLLFGYITELFFLYYFRILFFLNFLFSFPSIFFFLLIFFLGSGRGRPAASHQQTVRPVLWGRVPIHLTQSLTSRSNLPKIQSFYLYLTILVEIASVPESLMNIHAAAGKTRLIRAIAGTALDSFPVQLCCNVHVHPSFARVFHFNLSSS
jgi:hypothetical protein